MATNTNATEPTVSRREDCRPARDAERCAHAPAERFALEAELARHLPGLRRAALRLTRDRDEADDLVQETSLRAHRFAERYEPGSNLRAWLHRILSNTFASHYRRRRREREVLARVHDEGALTPLREQEGSSQLAAALSQPLRERLDALRPEYRAVLWAVAVDELSYREAADALGCPVGTVMSRLHRARNAMTHALVVDGQHAQGVTRCAA